jgi:Rad3-related DNA helicase
MQRKAERNAKLIQAAGRGLRAARDRTAEILSGSRLTTYDAQGRKSALAGQTRALGRF